MHTLTGSALRASLMVVAAIGAVSEAAAADSPSTSIGTPNQQMQEVLTVYGGIVGTPIVTLAPAKARQQFSVQDAAKLLARVSRAAEHVENEATTLDVR